MLGSLRPTALALLGGALLPLLPISPAAAAMVNVGGIDYDVSVASVSHALSGATFALPPSGQMPWWGDDALASEFASKVFSQLGPGWDSDYGPVFAYAIDTSLNQVLGLAQSLTDINDQIDVTPATAATASYAIATAPVPLPLPVLGAAAGLGWSRRLRRRVRQTLPISTGSPESGGIS